MTDRTIEQASVDSALAQFTEMMATDGYRLTWEEVEAQKVVVRIFAGPDACADCLVPRPVMEGIMAQSLADTSYTLDHVELPGAH